ncbi:DUF6356 family protein [Sphingobium subterraneum]|uniref:Capsule biosynthesis protein n=1 Tax=Sphingobium subterraneum TaxID=627688 RepID=A0A841J578_9SPHN|nr:DUF6356 family protein [Sphingobium subterraneum]MBB6123698.1 hypothetical protein [Sphingobium subterraneum]
MLDRLFLDHPRAVRESYGEHFVAACGFGAAMIVGGIACVLHAVVPALFVRTGSDVVRRLHERMVVKRVKSAGDGEALPAPQD